MSLGGNGLHCPHRFAKVYADFFHFVVADDGVDLNERLIVDGLVA